MDLTRLRENFYYHHLSLGRKDLPSEITLNCEKWQKIKTFKHDFFAATGLYENSSGEKIVLKIFRPRSFLGIPYQWLSLFEASHEEKAYRMLQDTGNVPEYYGRYGKTGIIHEYVPGKHLNRGTSVSENFFPDLEKFFLKIHQKGMAYLDTNKPDNIIVGDDGKPYLIDFQITWIQPRFPVNIITWPLFKIFKNSDLYHIRKHWRKIYPGKMTREELDAIRPWYIKIHRKIANPLRVLRRSYLRKIETWGSEKPEGSEKH